MVFVRLSLLLLRTPIILSSCNGLVVVRVDITCVKIFISPSLQRMARFDLNRISRSLLVPVSVMEEAFGRILLDSEPLSTACSLCRLMVSSSVHGP